MVREGDVSTSFLNVLRSKMLEMDFDYLSWTKMESVILALYELSKEQQSATTPAGTGVLQEGDGMPETVGTDVH